MLSHQAATATQQLTLYLAVQLRAGERIYEAMKRLLHSSGTLLAVALLGIVAAGVVAATICESCKKDFELCSLSLKSIQKGVLALHGTPRRVLVTRRRNLHTRPLSFLE